MAPLPPQPAARLATTAITKPDRTTSPRRRALLAVDAFVDCSHALGSQSALGSIGFGPAKPKIGTAEVSVTMLGHNHPTSGEPGLVHM